MQTTMKLSLVITITLTFILVSCSSPVYQESVPHTPTAILALPQLATSENNINRTSDKNVLLDFALSPTGDYLAIYTNEKVSIYSLTSGTESVIREFDDRDFTYLRSGAVTFSPDETKVAISGKFRGEQILIVDVSSKSVVSTISDIPASYWVTELEFRSDGQILLIRNVDPHPTQCETDEEKFVLYDLYHKNNWAESDIFKIDRGCILYPPLKYRFLTDNTLFLYSGVMSRPNYSAYFIDSDTGRILTSESYTDGEQSILYDISSNGALLAKRDISDGSTTLLNPKTNEIVDVVPSGVILLNDENRFLVSNLNNQWSLWENKTIRCIYDGLQNVNNTNTKISSNNKILVIFAPSGENAFQIWNIETCAMEKVIPFNE